MKFIAAFVYASTLLLHYLSSSPLLLLLFPKNLTILPPPSLSLTHSLTRSLTHSLIRSLILSLTLESRILSFSFSRVSNSLSLSFSFFRISSLKFSHEKNEFFFRDLSNENVQCFLLPCERRSIYIYIFTLSHSLTH